MARRRLPGDRGAFLRLLLSGLDGAAALQRGVGAGRRDADLGAEALAHRLRPEASPFEAAALLLELIAGAFLGVLYLAALRFAGGRVAAVIAVFVFVLGGGLGFVRLFSEIQHGGLSILGHLPHEYTLDRAPSLNLQWLNPVLAY